MARKETSHCGDVQMTPRQLISILYNLPSEAMDKEIWIDGDGFLIEVKDRKHDVVLSVFTNYLEGSAPSRSRR